MVNVKQIQKCREIYEENKEWLKNQPFIFNKKPFEEYDPEMFSKFIQEYKRLKGRHNYSTYSENLDMFFKITFNSWVHGDMKKVEDSEIFWNDKQEVWNCLVGYLGSIAEANRYFKSVDNVRSYS